MTLRKNATGTSPNSRATFSTASMPMLASMPRSALAHPPQQARGAGRPRVGTAVVWAALLAAALLPRDAGAQATKIDALRSAVDAAPRDPAAALALGKALRRAGRLADASRELRRALALGAAPGASSETALAVKFELARVLMDQEDFHGAIAACKRVAAAPGGVALGHACTAMAHMVRRRATDALPEAEQALALSPNMYEARLSQGAALRQNGALEDAEKALRAAVASAPSRVEAYVRLAEVLALEGKTADALDIARKARSVDPDDPDAALALGNLLKPGDEAVAALTAAVSGRPGFAAAFRRLAAVEIALGHYDRAERAALSALGLDKNDAFSHALLAQAYVGERKYDDGLHEARSALGMMKNLASAKLAEADALAGRGDIDLAIEAYQTAFGWMRDDPAPLLRGASASLAAGRPTTARAFADRATELFPKWAPAWAALGDALLRQRERAAARQAYEKALAAEGPIDRAAIAQKLQSLR